MGCQMLTMALEGIQKMVPVLSYEYCYGAVSSCCAHMHMHGIRPRANLIGIGVVQLHLIS